MLRDSLPRYYQLICEEIEERGGVLPESIDGHWLHKFCHAARECARMNDESELIAELEWDRWNDD